MNGRHPLLDLALSLAALLGHGVLWVALVNRLHATGRSRRLVKAITPLMHLALVAIPFMAVAAVVAKGVAIADFDPLASPLTPLRLYVGLCLAAAAVHVPRWCWDRLRRSLPAGAMVVARERFDLAAQLGPHPIRGLRGRLLARLPGNDILRLDVQQVSLLVPRAALEIDGLRIAHLSDLHMSGVVDRGFFTQIVGIVNQFQPDLIALTGDICDHDEQLDWIGPILGRLESPLGGYFVFGNHDRRVRDQARFCAELAAAGFTDLNAQSARVTIDGKAVLLAGNAAPWFAPPQPLEAGDESLRILLAHTPDHFGWARRQAFDLVLAGHTHGGQIRLPLFGPVFCPSWHGVRYAGGTFRSGQTLMHVSRGVSSLLPLRFNCPGEVSLLVLHSPLANAVSTATEPAGAAV